ncbi:hypothetical protein [Sphingomonas sp. OTU376]|uniref:hypothetical protein n=1 Tax=Sphingomonas sp. OTU376 TaxID=3043863 RepID=UPI00313D9814
MSALIEATPETWDAADLSVKRVEADGIERLEIEISNPRGLRDLVGTTDELTSALYALCDCFRVSGSMWREANYSVASNESGNWGFKASFAY